MLLGFSQSKAASGRFEEFVEGSAPDVAAKVSGEGLICGYVICDIT